MFTHYASLKFFLETIESIIFPPSKRNLDFHSFITILPMAFPVKQQVGLEDPNSRDRDQQWDSLTVSVPFIPKNMKL